MRPSLWRSERSRSDLPEDDTPLIDVVLAADTERASLMHEAETVEDPERMAYIYTRLDEIDAYDAPAPWLGLPANPRADQLDQAAVDSALAPHAAMILARAAGSVSGIPLALR